MIRLGLLTIFCCVVGFNAFRDWYKSLCGLILLMAIIEHPDVPKAMFGVPGLNAWNLVFIAIVVAWFTQREREKLTWDMPPYVNTMLWLYLGVILFGFARMMLDRTNLADETTASLISEELFNTVKWVFPGLLLFYGCRSKERLVWGLLSAISVYFLLALQVIKWMPPEYAIHGDELANRALKILVHEIGFHRVTMSMMLAGASWSVLALTALAKTSKQRTIAVVIFLMIIYAQALTGGRAGYGSWALLGIVLCVVKWRKYLPLIPVAALAIVLIAPGVVERMMEGMNPQSRDTNTALEQSGYMQDGGTEYTVTAGRTVAWEFVRAKITENPLFGFGRLAMRRTGISDILMRRFGESFPHPHNAYLEMLLDNGWLGMVLVLPFYLAVLRQSFSLFRDRRNTIFEAVGGVCMALVLALLLASVGSQSFYPVEASVPMWCAIGLLWRVVVERKRAEESPAYQAAIVGLSPTARAKVPLEIWQDNPGRPVEVPVAAAAAVAVSGWRSAMQPRRQPVGR